MIVGRFGDTSGRPYIEGRLVVLDVPLDVSFIVDTGADTTFLAPGDADRLGVDAALFGERNVQVRGLGKSAADCARTSALVTFEDEGTVRVYGIDLVVGFPDDIPLSVPSLLGRDVLNRWRMTYDPHHPERPTLEFEVRSADWSFTR